MSKKKANKRSTSKKNKKTPISSTKELDGNKFWLLKKFSKLSKAEKIITGICVLLGGILAAIQIYDRYNPPRHLTEREKFDSDYIDSTLKPPKITSITANGYEELDSPPIFAKGVNDDFPKIKGIQLKSKRVHLADFVAFHIGKTALLVPWSSLEAGIKISIPVKKSCNPSYISFGLKDDRVYVSVEFKDLLHEETIGVIEYNKWRLYKKNMFNFHNTVEKLEVIDRQNNIVFSIKFQIGVAKVNTIIVSGYFINPYAVSILSYTDIQYLKDGNMVTVGLDTCLSKSQSNWKQKAQEMASQIKTIFPLLPQD